MGAVTTATRAMDLVIHTLVVMAMDVAVSDLAFRGVVALILAVVDVNVAFPSINPDTLGLSPMGASMIPMTVETPSNH